MAQRTERKIADSDYRKLRDFRVGLRQFIRWSEEQATRAGITPSQHQLLLSVRASEHPRGPTMGEVAEQLFLKHHSAVELVDRAERAGLVRRAQDLNDHRVVRLELTDRGAKRLRELSSAHLDELSRIRPSLTALWKGLDEPARVSSR